jgi:hypothetical protein
MKVCCSPPPHPPSFSSLSYFPFFSLFSSCKRKLEYHGHFSGVNAELGQWTHLAFSYHPKRGIHALVNGKTSLTEQVMPWPTDLHGDLNAKKGVDMTMTLGGHAQQSSDTPHGMVSGGRLLTGKALKTQAILLEMEKTTPISPPPRILRNIIQPKLEVKKVDIGHEFGLTRTFNLASTGMDILFASYRPVGSSSDDSHGLNVTDILRHMSRKKTERDPLISPSYSYNELFGDPYPNIRKELFIRWRNKQHSVETIYESKWEEGQKVDPNLREQCAVPRTSSTFPYFMFASWNHDMTDSVDNLGLYSRYSAQDLLYGALNLLAGPLVAHRKSEAKKDTPFLSSPMAIEVAGAHFALDEGVNDNTTFLITHGAKWTEVCFMCPYCCLSYCLHALICCLCFHWVNQEGVHRSLGASSYKTCALACYNHAGNEDCIAWQWCHDTSICELLVSAPMVPHLMDTGPVHLQTNATNQSTPLWTAGLRPGYHQPNTSHPHVENYHSRLRLRRELASWYLRFALMINDQAPPSISNHYPPKPAAAMLLGYKTISEHSDIFTKFEGGDESGEVDSYDSKGHRDQNQTQGEWIDQFFVDHIVGKKGHTRRALKRSEKT